MCSEGCSKAKAGICGRDDWFRRGVHIEARRGEADADGQGFGREKSPFACEGSTMPALWAAAVKLLRALNISLFVWYGMID